MKVKIGLFVIFGLLFLYGTACNPAEPDPTPTPTPTPADYLAMAGKVMAEIKSVQFSLSREGSPIIVEPSLGATLISATGSYRSPDEVHASVKADLAGNVLTVDMLWIPAGIFMTNPLTGAFMKLTAEIPLDPVAIFDPEMGIAQILDQAINDPTVLGEEDIEGVASLHLTGKANPEEVSVLAPAGLSGELFVDLWLDSNSYQVTRIKLTEESGDQTILDFFAYNEPVEIPSPG
jgi:hypothetical protein